MQLIVVEVYKLNLKMSQRIKFWRLLIFLISLSSHFVFFSQSLTRIKYNINIYESIQGSSSSF